MCAVKGRMAKEYAIAFALVAPSAKFEHGDPEFAGHPRYEYHFHVFVFAFDSIVAKRER